MNDVDMAGQDLCAIYVDLGTTNTRAWLMRGGEVLARARKHVGVRASAHDGSNARIRAALKELITNLQSQNNGDAKSCSPVCVVAAGMIGSPLGLAELPHLAAPAGLRELSDAARRFDFPEVTELPFLLVPGVRSGPATADFRSLAKVDVMRGEETLCVGLQALGLITVPVVVLTLGSHWKAIQLDADGRIQSSFTSLSGELIHAVRTRTILASSVANEWAAWPDKLSPEWMEAGMQEQRRSGLPRALFCVRLVGDEGTPDDRFAFLLGAFIGTDLDALVARGVLADHTQVVISGHALIAEAWKTALVRRSIGALVLDEGQTEKAFLTGLQCILARSAIETTRAEN